MKNSDKIVEEILEILKSYEGLRIKLLTALIVSTLIIFGLNSGYIFTPDMFTGEILYLSIMSVFVTLFVPIWLIHYIIYKTFSIRIKKACFPKVLELFENIDWSTDNRISIFDSLLESSNLFGAFNTRNDDDSFNGVYKDTKFSAMETCLLNKGEKLAWLVFQGLIITVESNKKTKGKTLISTKGDMNIKNSNPIILILAILISIDMFYRYGMIAGIITTLIAIIAVITAIKNNRELEPTLGTIKLEDPDFNRRYNICSTDQIEGRYLVTTAFMERFKNLHTVFGSRKAKCAFFDGQVMFAISTRRNLFELGGLFVPLTNPKQVKKLLAEISAIYSIIDYFKLAEKTGL